MAWNPIPRRRAELVRGRPDDPFSLLETHIQRFFDEPWSVFGSSRNATRAATAPLSAQLDVHDDGDALVLDVELPGVAEDDIDVSITNDVLRLRAEKREERKEERKGSYIEERSFGSFERSIRLPVEVEADEAQATYERGVLHLVLPKSRNAREATKRIAVRSQNGANVGTSDG